MDGGSRVHVASDDPAAIAAAAACLAGSRQFFNQTSVVAVVHGP
jgi:hypothetical protein